MRGERTFGLRRRPRTRSRPAIRSFGGVGMLAVAIFAGACERGPAPTAREVLEDGTFLTLGGGNVTLSAGTGAADGARHELLLTTEGDLDFDSEPDAAAVLVEAQGQERFLTLHALLREGDDVTDVSARLLGDRIEAHRVSIEEGVIRVDVRIRRPGAPITARPSVDLTRHFVLTDRGVIPILLTEVARTETPAAPAATNEAGPTPLHAVEWELESVAMGDWSADGRGLEEPVALRFLAERVDGADVTGQVSGSAGCNRLFGSFRTREGEALRFYGLALTRRSCGEREATFEARLMEALGGVQAFSLSEDRLILALIDGATRFRAGGRLVPVAPAAGGPGAAEDDGETG